MLVDTNEPIKHIRFIPVDENSTWGTGQSYMFKCRTKLNYQTETMDIDIIFDTEKEKKDYKEYEHNRKNGVEYYSEITDI